MNRNRKIVISVILIVFAVYIWGAFESFFRISAENENNAKIDFSCTTDQDCMPKNEGCGMCSGIQRACMSKNSVEGVCLGPMPLVWSGCMTCMVSAWRIDSMRNWSCICINNSCTDYVDNASFKNQHLLTRKRIPYINPFWFLGNCE
jgi:hypothetical protein